MILNQFVKHLEKRDSLLGWLIISKESYQNSKLGFIIEIVN